MQLSKFLHAKDPKDNTVDLIIYTKYPYYIGKVVQFRTEDSTIDFIASKRVLSDKFLGAKINGYYMIVIYAGSLEDVDESQVYKEVPAIFTGMADDYLENRIKHRESRFKRWRE